MAFTSSITGRVKAGDKFVTWGVWDATGVTGGDINTGLRVCDICLIQHTGTAVEANVGVVNETFSATAPLAGSAITIVVTSGDAGTWYAIGRD